MFHSSSPIFSTKIFSFSFTALSNKDVEGELSGVLSREATRVRAGLFIFLFLTTASFPRRPYVFLPLGFEATREDHAVDVTKEHVFSNPPISNESFSMIL